MKKFAVITALIALTLNLAGVAASAAGGGFCRGIDRDASVCQR